MEKPRIEDIARKLREEAESFVGYAAIEEESASLGFPTSVRTLRFYVSEGVLPPPRRQGKTPVYSRQWILNALLAIHLMKTRLRRGLAEVKEVFRRLTEDPELLADKCAQLYEFVSQPGQLMDNISQADAELVVDRFFERLASGRGQPSEVAITELAAELKRGDGAPVPADLGPGPSARGNPSECRGKSPEDSAAQARAADSRARDEARKLENVFIRGFEAAFQSVASVYHPLEGKDYPSRSSAREPVIADEYLRVVEILKEARSFDRALFDSLPLDKSTRFNIYSGRLVNRRLKLAVVGANWSPTADLVRPGRSASRAGAADLRRVLDRVVDASAVFFYVGIHSTSGWDPEVRSSIPRGDNYRVALVEFDDDVGWRVWDDFPPEASDLAELFDPESRQEKVERCLERIRRLRELEVRGGFVPLDELSGELKVPDDILEEALERVVEPEGGFRLVTVRGQRLLKRDRLSG